MKKQNFSQLYKGILTVAVLLTIGFIIYKLFMFWFETPAQKENEILKTEQNTLKTDIKTYENDLKTAKKKITQLEEQLGDLPIQNKRLQKERDDFEATVKKHEDERRRQLTESFTSVGNTLIDPFLGKVAFFLAVIIILMSMFTPFDSSLSFFDKIWQFIRRAIPMLIIEILIILEGTLLISGMGKTYSGSVIFGVWINTFLIAIIGFILFKIFKFVYGQMNHKIKVIEHTQKRQYTKQIGQSKKTILLTNKNKKRPKKKQEEEIYEEDDDDEHEEYDDDEYDDDDY